MLMEWASNGAVIAPQDHPDAFYSSLITIPLDVLE